MTWLCYCLFVVSHHVAEKNWVPKNEGCIRSSKISQGLITAWKSEVLKICTYICSVTNTNCRGSTSFSYDTIPIVLHSLKNMFNTRRLCNNIFFFCQLNVSTLTEALVLDSKQLRKKLIEKFRRLSKLE